MHEEKASPRIYQRNETNKIRVLHNVLCKYITRIHSGQEGAS